MTNYEQFLLDRRNELCGSDIAAILGISPWRTPLDVYLDKTSEGIEKQDSEALARGKTVQRSPRMNSKYFYYISKFKDINLVEKILAFIAYCCFKTTFID